MIEITRDYLYSLYVKIFKKQKFKGINYIKIAFYYL